jgi:hypothetical protein
VAVGSPFNHREVLKLLSQPMDPEGVTPDYTGKTECISRVRQDQFTHT